MPSLKRDNPYYQAQEILSRRDHSEYELRAKMRRKRFSQEQIDEVARRLKKINLINDAEFAVKFTDNILLFKPVGPRWIKQKLKQKGIAQIVIEDLMEATFSYGREKDLAQRAAAQWKRTHRPKSSERNDKLRFRQRLANHLASRGFSYDVIAGIKV